MGADAVRLGLAGLCLIRRKKAGTICTRRAKASLRGAPIVRMSLQSENGTNDPLKSGPAKAGPAGPATPPLPCIFSSSTPDIVCTEIAQY